MMMMLMIKIHDCSDNTLFGIERERVNEPWRICNPSPQLRRLACRARLFQIAV